MEQILEHLKKSPEVDDENYLEWYKEFHRLFSLLSKEDQREVLESSDYKKRFDI